MGETRFLVDASCLFFFYSFHLLFAKMSEILERYLWGEMRAPDGGGVFLSRMSLGRRWGARDGPLTIVPFHVSLANGLCAAFSPHFFASLAAG